MGGGKGGKAAAPDYTPVAQANEEAARISASVAREQLAWAREQYARDRDVTDSVLDVMIPNMERESSVAQEDRERYKSTIQPMEDALIKEANEYDSPQRQEQMAGRAQADVAQAFDAQRTSALETLRSYGVDPSMARAGALDTGVQVARAAASAGAAENSRLTTEATGRALRGEVINLGRGYQGQIAQAYETARQAGQGGVASNLATTGSGAQTMGTGVQWANNQAGILGNWGNQITSQANNAVNANTARANQQSSSIGAGVGVLAGLAGSFATGGAAGGVTLAGLTKLMTR